MIAMSDTLFDSISRLLSSARGQQNAVTLAQIAEQLSASRRDVEATIEHNLTRFPYVLVAGAGGYYIPIEADDINRYLHNLHSRHRRMQLREAVVRHKARAAGWLEESGRFVRPAQLGQQELFSGVGA
jgi:hypothetical protein